LPRPGTRADLYTKSDPGKHGDKCEEDSDFHHIILTPSSDSSDNTFGVPPNLGSRRRYARLAAFANGFGHGRKVISGPLSMGRCRHFRQSPSFQPAVSVIYSNPTRPPLEYLLGV
jgi:hypothetical protein